MDMLQCMITIPINKVISNIPKEKFIKSTITRKRIPKNYK
jgi:hypothetical protein